MTISLGFYGAPKTSVDDGPALVQGAGQRTSGTTLTLPDQLTVGNLIVGISTFVGTSTDAQFSHGMTVDHSWSHQGWSLVIASCFVGPDNRSPAVTLSGVSATDGRNAFVVAEFSGLDKLLMGETTWLNQSGADGNQLSLEALADGLALYVGYLNTANNIGATSDGEDFEWIYNNTASYSFMGYMPIPEPGLITINNTFRPNREDRHSFVGYQSLPDISNFDQGTITEPGDGYRYHTFTDTTQRSVLSLATSKTIEYLVVGGGGGGGGDTGGGGGGGGVIQGTTFFPPGDYLVSVGSGGAGSTSNINRGSNGENTVFSQFTAIGGGGGGTQSGGTARSGLNGASGGGSAGSAGSASGGVGIPGQGQNGGSTIAGALSSGGGGGASQLGQNISSADGVGGNGGDGIEWPIGSGNYYGGGGGGAGGTTQGLGGLGGGSNAGAQGANLSGTPNTGGGGGGCSYIHAGGIGPGGSGIVIARYEI